MDRHIKPLTVRSTGDGSPVPAQDITGIITLIIGVLTAIAGKKARGAVSGG